MKGVGVRESLLGEPDASVEEGEDVVETFDGDVEEESGDVVETFEDVEEGVMDEKVGDVVGAIGDVVEGVDGSTISGGGGSKPSVVVMGSSLSSDGGNGMPMVKGRVKAIIADQRFIDADSDTVLICEAATSLDDNEIRSPGVLQF